MTYITLDHIVRSALSQKNLSIHWYFQYLKLAADCLREFNYDILGTVQTKRIKVDENNVAKLPDDFIDYTKIGMEVSQFVRPLVQNQAINRLPKLDDDGNETTYTQKLDGIGTYYGGMWYLNSWNKYGEHVGGYFGYKQRTWRDGFKIIKERGIIQLTEGVCTDFIVLEYISSGTNCDAACKINPFAQKAIESYVFWKASPNRFNNFSPEAQQFFNDRRILVARVDHLSLDDIKRVMNQNKIASIK